MYFIVMHFHHLLQRKLAIGGHNSERRYLQENKLLYRYIPNSYLFSLHLALVPLGEKLSQWRGIPNSSAAAIFPLDERNTRVLASREREPSRQIAHNLALEPAATAALLGRGKARDLVLILSSLVGEKKL